MAQQFLNGPKVGAIAQQVRGIGVPQTVRMDGGIAGDHSGVKLHDPARPSIGEPASAMIQEQR